MAKIVLRKIVPVEFDDIPRGSSVTIPLLFTRSDGTPFILDGYKVLFTLKAAQYDHDYDDDRALICREFDPEDDPDAKELGRVDIKLSSKETWLHPGQYFFDVVLVKGPSALQICLCTTNIVGTPTNRNITDEISGDILITNTITANPEALGTTLPIQTVTPLVSDPPQNLVETFETDPPYMLEWDKTETDKERFAKLTSFAPRVALPFRVSFRRGDTDVNTAWRTLFIHELPLGCPLAGCRFSISQDLKFQIGTTRPMQMWWTTGYSAERLLDRHDELVHDFRTTGGQGTTGDLIQLSNDNKDGWLGNGYMMAHVFDGNDTMDIMLQFHIGDDGEPCWVAGHAMWFNWFDIFEPEAEAETPEEFETTNAYPPIEENPWPPEPMFQVNGG